MLLPRCQHLCGAGSGRFWAPSPWGTPRHDDWRVSSTPHPGGLEPIEGQDQEFWVRWGDGSPWQSELLCEVLAKVLGVTPACSLV